MHDSACFHLISVIDSPLQCLIKLPLTLLQSCLSNCHSLKVSRIACKCFQTVMNSAVCLVYNNCMYNLLYYHFYHTCTPKVFKLVFLNSKVSNIYFLAIFQGGMYVFQIFDYYAGSRIIILVAFLECATVAWLYGINRFYDNMEMMLGRRIDPYMKISWTFTSPIFCLVRKCIKTGFEYEWVVFVFLSRYHVSNKEKVSLSMLSCLSSS